MRYPEIFVPAFAEILPSVLDNLLAFTLVMRSNALNALGGFALGFAQCTPSAMHEDVTALVIEFLTVPPSDDDDDDAPRLNEVGSSKNITPIVRTLRTTLAATAPKAAAQGPVWAWGLLACFAVLLGPALFKEERVMRTMMALQALGMRHPRSSIRGLGCLVWRSVTWAWMQQFGQRSEPVLDINSKAWLGVRSVNDLGAGVATIGALLAAEEKPRSSAGDINPRLVYAIDVLGAMSSKGGLTCKEAMDTLSQLVCPATSESPEWDMLRLLPLELFSSLNGLQAADFNRLAQVVRPILNKCPTIEDLRPLTVEEIADERVWQALKETWKDGIKSLQIAWGMEIPVSHWIYSIISGADLCLP